MDFKLDPPGRAKSQAALVSVTGVIDTDADSVAQPAPNVQPAQPTVPLTGTLDSSSAEPLAATGITHNLAFYNGRALVETQPVQC